MEFQRTKNSTRTFIFGVIEKIATIFLPFLVRTVIIRQLGIDYAGLSSLFVSVLNVLNIGELGVASAATFCMYDAVSKDDTSKINALLRFVRNFYKILGFAILAVGLALMPLLRFLIKGEYPSDINLYVLYIFYLLNAIVSYLGFAYRGILLQAYQRGDVTYRIQTLLEVLKCICQILAIVLFKNYYLAIICLLVSTLLNTLFTGLASKKMFPKYHPEGKLSEEDKRIIKSKVIFLALFSISAKLITSADNIVISSFSGLVATGIYGNYTYISNAVLGFVLVAYTSVAPAIGNCLVLKSKEENIKLFDAISLGSFWIYAWCTICLLCLYQPFISIWVGEENQLPFMTVIAISLLFFSNASTQFFSSCYISTAGLWNKSFLPKLLASVLNLALDLALVHSLGTFGIVIASFASYYCILLPLDMFITYKHILKVDRPVWNVFKTLGIQTITVVGVSAIMLFLCSLITDTGIWALIKKTVICLTFPILMLFSIFSGTDAFKNLASHIRGLFSEARKESNL